MRSRIALLVARHRHLILVLLLTTFAGSALLFSAEYARILAYEGNPPEREGAQLFDRNGELIAVLPRGRGRYVPLDEIPPYLIDAVIAVEDARFWKHPGIDPIGIARALVHNLRAQAAVEGGSTITQQLARTLFLSRQSTLGRKLEEAALALLLEERYGKEKVLELYLNNVYFGAGAYGLAAASRAYFSKEPAGLSLAEAALLAGLLASPSRFSPLFHPDAARHRRDTVLSLMVKEGFLPREAAARARAAPLGVLPSETGRAPYFVDWVTHDLSRRYPGDLRRVGWRVYTSLDLRLQRAAERALGGREGAMVALDPQTGEVLAMVGGPSYEESSWNRAVRAVRQPGSALKPFVYAAALAKGFTTADLLLDAPLESGGYRPRNFGDRYLGRVTLQEALAQSLNTATVRLLTEIGVGTVYELLRRLGITTLTPSDRTLALGLGGLTAGVTPLELAAAYQPFANGGRWFPPHGVVRIETVDGELVDEAKPLGRQVLSPQTAYLVTHMLRAAVEAGTGRLARLAAPVAGKTGTTDDGVDAWFVGYTPHLVAAVWLGNDDRTPLGGSGGELAAPVWAAFARDALAVLPADDFSPPPGIVKGVKIDGDTGLRWLPGCGEFEVHAFRAGTEPAGFCEPLPPAEVPGEDPPASLPGASPPVPVLPGNPLLPLFQKD